MTRFHNCKAIVTKDQLFNIFSVKVVEPVAVWRQNDLREDKMFLSIEKVLEKISEGQP